MSGKEAFSCYSVEQGIYSAITGCKLGHNRPVSRLNRLSGGWPVEALSLFFPAKGNVGFEQLLKVERWRLASGQDIALNIGSKKGKPDKATIVR